MTTLLEKITGLNDLVVEGKLLEAFEKYYHDEVVMQENDAAPTSGKNANRKRESEFVQSLKTWRARPLKVTIGEQVTMVEWLFDYIHTEWGEKNYKQVSVQEWKDSLIVREKFYYAS